MTLRIVLIALMPSAPDSSEARAGSVMCVMLGVIFAQNGRSVASRTQAHTSRSRSGFCPIAAPIARSGSPCGQEKLSSNPSTPLASQRSMISNQRSFPYSSITDAMSTRSG